MEYGERCEHAHRADIAMGEVDDANHPEEQADAHRHQRINRAQGDGVNQLLDDQVHVRKTDA
jgi:hypothetical protein